MPIIETPDWKNPDYRAILLERTERLKWIRANPTKLPSIKEYYKDHIADFISDFAMTVDPRVSGKGRNPVMPLILMPRQRELVDWIIAMWRGGDPGIAGEVSRRGPPHG